MWSSEVSYQLNLHTQTLRLPVFVGNIWIQLGEETGRTTAFRV